VTIAAIPDCKNYDMRYINKNSIKQLSS